jgi:hypothetical protein
MAPQPVPLRDLNGLEVLDHEECLALLRTQSVGRVGLSSGALPIVLPVHFEVVDAEIRLLIRPGTTLAAATRQAIVAFEVDQVDPISGAGWSVMVQGVSRRRASTTPSDGTTGSGGRGSNLDRWSRPRPTHLVGISMDVVSGRRIDDYSEFVPRPGLSISARL